MDAAEGLVPQRGSGSLELQVYRETDPSPRKTSLADAERSERTGPIWAPSTSLSAVSTTRRCRDRPRCPASPPCYSPLRTSDATLRMRSGSPMMSSSTTRSLTTVKATRPCGCPSSVITTPAAPLISAGRSTAAGLAPRRACRATAAAPRTIIDALGRTRPKVGPEDDVRVEHGDQLKFVYCGHLGAL